MATSGCKSCVVSHYIEISRDDFVTTYELPAIQKTTKTFAESAANRTRHSHSNEQFVSPCGADSRTPQYAVQALFCVDDPIYWYLRDGDIVKAKFYKNRGATSLVQIYADEAAINLISNPVDGQVVGNADTDTTWSYDEGTETWTDDTTAIPTTSDIVEELEVKYVDGGWDWDNTTEDGEEISFTFEATSTVKRSVPKATGTVPYEYG